MPAGIEPRMTGTECFAFGCLPVSVDDDEEDDRDDEDDVEMVLAESSSLDELGCSIRSLLLDFFLLPFFLLSFLLFIFLLPAFLFPIFRFWDILLSSEQAQNLVLFFFQ